MNYAHEVIKDPMVQESGAFVDVPGPDGDGRDGGDAGRLLGHALGAAGPAPELGQHTEEVLLELGYDWDQIIALKEAGAIP